MACATIATIDVKAKKETIVIIGLVNEGEEEKGDATGQCEKGEIDCINHLAKLIGCIRWERRIIRINTVMRVGVFNRDKANLSLCLNPNTIRNDVDNLTIFPVKHSPLSALNDHGFID